jgi:large-conductance mechanosensitive channel
MIDFIKNEKIITIALFTSIFTATLIGSFKRNIIDPAFERVAPSHKLDFVPNSNQTHTMQSLLDAGNYDKKQHAADHYADNARIKWQTFLKDLFIWLFIIFIIYIIYLSINHFFKKK